MAQMGMVVTVIVREWRTRKSALAENSSMKCRQVDETLKDNEALYIFSVGETASYNGINT